MKWTTLFLPAILWAMMVFSIFVSNGQAYNVTTTYTVNVHTDGTASWAIVQSAYLQTLEEQTGFEQNISQAVVYSDIFASKVAGTISSAYNKTGRMMTAENISVGGNVTENGVGAYGFLVYSFDWTNFATLTGKEITLGDAFSNESFLFGDGELAVLFPTGYEVKNCFPSPNQNSDGSVKWDTVGNFQNGQPTIILSEIEANGFFPVFPLLLGTSLAIVAIVLLSVLVFRTRKKNKEKREAFPTTVGNMGDTEKILALIQKEGGHVLQSRITEQLRFSKAKTSKILGDMEDKGIIKRDKTGRDKVVSSAEKARD